MIPEPDFCNRKRAPWRMVVGTVDKKRLNCEFKNIKRNQTKPRIYVLW